MNDNSKPDNQRERFDSTRKFYHLGKQKNKSVPESEPDAPMPEYLAPPPGAAASPPRSSSASAENSSAASSDSLYLKQLVYKPKDGKTFLNFFIKNFRITILIVLALLLWGVISLNMLPLESTPEVKIPYGMVSVVMPGASPADMEELVLNKIESRLTNLSGVKQIRSSASNSFAAITVEFRAEEDLKDALRRLRDAVSQSKVDLPAEASEPTVMEVSFSSIPVWTLVVTGPYDSFTLRRYAELVRTELEKLPGASEVNLSGGDIFEARISYDPQKLQAFGLTADAINSTIKADNFGLPSGTIKISNFEYTIKVEGKITEVKTLRNLPVSVLGGQIVRLSDVSDVVEMAGERKIFNYFSVNGAPPQNAVTLNVVKKTGSSIIELIDNGKVAIAKLKKNGLPADLHVEDTMDMSKTIRKDIDQLVRDGLLTIIFVFTILFLFVGLKEAFVAGLAVPLVFCATFGLMLQAGLTLNFLSLFSLILSLGLLVDDAIVVVQATKQYLATGKFTPEEAVLLVFRDFKVLLTTTTLATIWAFLPLLLASGIIGSFIKSIPITVSITLAASYVVAIIINHPMAIILERFRLTKAVPKAVLGILAALTVGSIYMTVKGTIGGVASILLIAVPAVLFFALLAWYRLGLKEKMVMNEQLILEEMADDNKIKAKIYHHYLADESEKTFTARIINGLVKMDKILPYYGKLLMSILKSKIKILLVMLLVAILFMGALALPAMGILRSEFIPPADSEYMYINIEGAPGLITEKTREVASKVQEILYKENQIKSFSVVIGAGGVSTSSRMGSTSSNGQTNKAQIAINLYPYKTRPIPPGMTSPEKSYTFANRLRQLIAPIGGAKIEVSEVSGGPPSGADFEAHISGDDMQKLEQIANQYKDILGKIPGAVNLKINLDYTPGEFTIKLDYDQMQLRGITSAQVASILRTALSGSDVTKILRDGDDLNVRSEFKNTGIDSIDKIRNLQLANPRGQVYTLGDIADVQIGSALTAISHIDTKRVVVLTASVVKPYLPGEVLKQFQADTAGIPLPQGYDITYGGATETNTESIYSILRAMIVAGILIIATLVIQFNSFRKAILVLATIPLAVTGVFYGLTLIGLTLSFPALIGIVALFGVVVKNAIILVDKINLNLKVGIPFLESIVDAAKSRLEAIFLTSICTIVGMIPITLSDETWAGLGASLIFGLSTSTFLTLIIIPVLYSLLVRKPYEKDEKLRKLKVLSEA
jgi:multidrug efflux pump subunit AcrB